MEIYIDEKNFLSFLSSSNNELFGDCQRMIKRNFEIKFTFPQSKIKENMIAVMWINSITSGLMGGSGIVLFDQHAPERPLKSNFYLEFLKDSKKMSGVYLLADDNIEEVSKRKFMLVSGVGEEIQTLSSLFFDDYQYTKVLNAQKNLKSWEDINSYLSPCTDIILSDNFLLNDSSVFQNNVYSLLAQICSFANNAKLNIVIFTVKQNIAGLTTLKEIRQGIKKAVEKVTNNPPEVTFVLNEELKRGVQYSLEEKKRIEHDRTIFTNYKLISSGDTFNYFNGHWEVITCGRWLNVLSLADKDNFANAIEFVEKLQKTIDNIYSKNRADDLIDGPCKSNYLVFRKES